MMRILHVAGAYLPYIGGASLRLSSLLSEMAASCELNLLVPRKDIHGQDIYEVETKSYEVLDGVHVHRVPKVSDLRKAVRALSREHNIDLIHAHNPRFALLGLLAFTRKPLICEIHAVTDVSWPKRLVNRLVYRFSDGIIVLSNSAKEELTRRYKIPPDKIEVIYNGIETWRFKPSGKGALIREKYGIAGKPVIGYIGTFYEWQGVEDLVRAFSLVAEKEPDARLLLVGDGPDLERVRSIIDGLLIADKVTLTGRVPPTEVPHYFEAIDVFVIARPSTISTQTAVPLKLLEAMAMAKAIIATDVRGLSEVVNDRVNGLLIPPGNVEELASQVLELLADEPLRRKIGSNAREQVEREFSWARSAEKVLKLYEKTLKTGSRA
jgi:glycosyltransferase involved in cell wall biosynthesis